MLSCIFQNPNETMPQCIDRLKGGEIEFYDLRHQSIYSTLLIMFDKREEINVITVMQSLKDKQMLEQIGGIGYLMNLQDVAPSAAGVSAFLEILHEKYLLRRVISTCTDVVSKVYDYEGEVDIILDDVEKSILKISEERVVSTTPTTFELVRQAVSNIEEAWLRKGAISGVPTGFTDLDRMTNGLQYGDMIIIAGRPSMGKAQPIHTSCVLTPGGWKTMGEIKVGDWVVGADGTPKKVLGVYPQGVIPVVEVRFSDGTATRCSLDHLWFTQTRNERRRGSAGSVKTTAEIMRTITRKDSGSPNHAIPVTKPVEFNRKASLPLHPWLLGALIGDGGLSGGNVHFSKPETDVQQKFISLLPETDCAVVASTDGMTLRVKRKTRSNSKSRTKEEVERMGLDVLSGLKFIPRDYLYSDPQSRLELLRGLLDTDGHVCETGCAVEYSSSSEQLANDVAHLARSLGGIVSEPSRRTPHYKHKGERRDGCDSHRIHIRFLDRSIVPVSSSKHLAGWRTTDRFGHKSIVGVRPIGGEECQCIRVDSPDGLYVTDQFIVTHNTSLVMNVAENVAVNFRIPTGVFSVEMTAGALITRMVCSRARVSLRSIQSGFLAERDFPKLTQAAGEISRAPLYIDDSGDISVLQARTKARRWVQQFGIKLLIIDYLQLMNALHSKRAHEGRQNEISEISRGIKGLAKELKIPVIVLSQLNRDLDRETKRKPRLSDLRDSGSLEQDADFVGILYGDRNDEDPDPEVAQVNLWIGKQRNNIANVDVQFTFFKTITRFESAARIDDEDVPEAEETPTQARLPYGSE